jgi:hypothetical protein
LAKLEAITLDVQVDTSRLRASMRLMQKAAWRLARQRRTLRWRRLEDGTVQTQQRLVPWAPPIFLPMISEAVQAAMEAELAQAQAQARATLAPERETTPPAPES